MQNQPNSCIVKNGESRRSCIVSKVCPALTAPVSGVARRRNTAYLTVHEIVRSKIGRPETTKHIVEKSSLNSLFLLSDGPLLLTLLLPVYLFSITFTIIAFDQHLTSVPTLTSVLTNPTQKQSTISFLPTICTRIHSRLSTSSTCA